jgi:transposase
MLRRYRLRDDQWDVIKDLLPGRAGTAGGTARDNRLFVDAVLYRYRAGIPWRDLPECFGNWKNVHKRFSRWAQSGIWQTVMAHLTDDADNEYAMIDSTIVRAHQHSAGALKKRATRSHRTQSRRLEYQNSRGSRCAGQSDRLLFDGRASQRFGGADILLSDLAAAALVADKGCNAEARVKAPLLQAGKEAVIPPKSNRTAPQGYDKHLHQARHLIENFFAKLKQFRAIATRYDKTARNFLAAIHLVGATIWLA